MKEDGIMKSIPFNIKKTLFNKAGQASFIEFSVGFLMMVVLLTIVFQVYGLMQAQTVTMNVVKEALRRVELNGGSPEVNLNSEVIDELSKVNGIDIASINVTGVGTQGQYQLRDPITLKVTANYNFIMFGLNVASVPLSISYTGSSEKFNKNLPYTVFN